jgi:uncharacterized protein YndB with AHSA1/START domain
MNVSDIDSITCEVRIAARPETVFAFFTDPVKMLRWKGVDAELDPRPGGVYAVNVNGRDRMRGQYLELVPNEKIVFTWGWEDPALQIPPGATTVEVTLTPDGDGGTHVRLVHRGLVSAALRSTHRAGWEHYLARLAVAAAGGDPGPDPLRMENSST